MNLMRFAFIFALSVAANLSTGLANGVPVISSATSFTVTPGVTVAYQISASNSPASYSATGLPTYWTINSSTGIVQGLVPVVGTVGNTITFNVTATNGAGTSSAVPVNYNVVAGAVVSQQYRIGSLAAPAPIPFWASSPVLPNDTILVTGGRLLSSTTAQLALLNNGVTGSPSLPTLSSPVWGGVTPGTATSRSLHVGIPASWSQGIYALRMVNGSTQGPAILVNAPDPWFAMGAGGIEASPGGTLYVSGHGLAYAGQATQVSLVQNGTSVATITATSMANDQRGWSYAVTAAIPASLPVGLYDVWIHNGFGGPDGWAKVADPLSVIPSFAWPSGTVDFTSMPCSDGDAKMAAAIAAVPGAGGTILLPARTISLTSSLVLPKLCRLKGADKTTTLLSFAGNCSSPLINGWMYPDHVRRDTFALEDLKIYAPAAFTGVAVQRAYQPAYLPGWMKRVDVQLDAPLPPGGGGGGGNVGISVWLRQTTDFVVEDCVLDSAMPVAGLDTVSGFRISRCTIDWRDSSLFLRGVTTHVIADNCTFNIRGDPTTNRWVEAANPNPGIWFGAFKAGIGSIGGQYIKNVLISNCINTRDDHSYPMPGYVGFTTDGETSIYNGPFTASGTSIILPAPTQALSAGVAAVYDWTGCRASILEGTGAGQHRTITSGAIPGSSSLAIDRPWDVAPDPTSIIDIGCQVGNTLLVDNDWSEARLIQHYFAGVNNTVAGGTIGSSDGQSTQCVSWSGYHYNGYLPAAQMQYLSINNQFGQVTYKALTADFSSLALTQPRYAAQASYVARDMRETNGGNVSGITYSGYTSGAYTVHMPIRDLLFENFPGPLTYTRLDDYGGSYAARLIDDQGTHLPTTAVRLSDNPYPLPTIAPAFSTQPINQSINIGATATFTVVASGNPPPTLQWYRDTTPLVGQNSATLILTNVQPASAASYSCVASNSAGTVTSSTVILSIIPAPVIATQPLTQSCNVGSIATFSVVATNATSYQWSKDGRSVPGATTSIFTIWSVQPSDAGDYACTASNGSGAVTSNSVALTVLLPPTITTQPNSQTIAVGESASFSVVAVGSLPLTFQWKKNGTIISGANNSTYDIARAQSSDAANYSVLIANADGTIVSAAATLSVNTPMANAPAITSQPDSRTVNLRSAVNFSITAVNAVSYQWNKDGAVISGATSSTYSILSVQTGDAGNYTCTASNANGATTSSAARLTVTGPPTITTQPDAQTVAAGGTVTFSIVATNATTYQWFKDGIAIPGATSTTFALPNVQEAAAGNYNCLVSNSTGSTASAIVALTIGTNVMASRLINISTRSLVSTDANIQIAGFVIRGSQPKTLVVRASGPALIPAPFSVQGTLADPVLTLFQANTIIATNDDWSSDASTATALETAFASAGAFPFTRGSKDAALLVTLDPGAYTAQVSGKSGKTGVALVEVYEVGSSATSHLINISTRSLTQPGNNIQIAGFVITGTQPKTLLIRANGAVLSLPPFNLSGTLADPVLTVFDTQNQIASNDDWSSDLNQATVVEAAVTSAGAFSWTRGSKDAALVLTLSPGAYTAQVTGKNGTTGITLIEVYEMP